MLDAKHSSKDGARGDDDRVGRLTCVPLSPNLIYIGRVDNSEASRNGDYVPSRWEAQVDSVNLIFHSKTQANPESSVGLMSMGGSGPQVLTTLTTNPGQVLDGLHRTKVKGESHLYTGIMIASVRSFLRICNGANH